MLAGTVRMVCAFFACEFYMIPMTEQERNKSEGRRAKKET